MQYETHYFNDDNAAHYVSKQSKYTWMLYKKSSCINYVRSNFQIKTLNWDGIVEVHVYESPHCLDQVRQYWHCPGTNREQFDLITVVTLPAISSVRSLFGYNAWRWHDVVSLAFVKVFLRGRARVQKTPKMLTLQANRPRRCNHFRSWNFLPCVWVYLWKQY